MSYDSRHDTLIHINRVRELVDLVQANLTQRKYRHDLSKLEEPEKSVFDEFTPKLKGSTYGSEEYKSHLAAMKPALDHHYVANSHHPEHYQKQVCIICFAEFPANWKSNCNSCGNGQLTPEPNVGGMTLLDVIEMFCDWKAATERHANGSLAKSIEINRERFKIEPQLAQILRNTAREMGWVTEPPPKAGVEA